MALVATAKALRAAKELRLHNAPQVVGLQAKQSFDVPYLAEGGHPAEPKSHTDSRPPRLRAKTLLGTLKPMAVVAGRISGSERSGGSDGGGAGAQGFRGAAGCEWYQKVEGGGAT